MESLTILWLTGDTTWDPSSLDVEDEEVLSPDEPGYGGVVNQLNAVSDFQKTLRGYNFVNYLVYTLGATTLLPTLFRVFNGRKKKKVEVKTTTRDYEQYRRLLGWIPVETVRKTFEATTQLAKVVPLRLPLRRHIKSRFPQLNCRRLSETYATDTLFSSEDALGGIRCAQLYVGLKSMFIAIYGMHSETEGPDTLDDFVREFGAPHGLRNDNSKMQLGNNFRNVLRKYNIKQSMTEPHHPQQNPAERKIQEVKKYTNKIMDRTGAPAKLWFLCMLYTVQLLNHTAMEALKWRTPVEAAFGETPDISMFLQFEFYEPVYYLSPDASFPETKEQLGHFVGVSANTGDAMCYLILTDKKTILVRSVVRSALKKEETNARQPIPDSSREGRFTDTVELKAAHEDKRESQETDYNLPTFAINDAIGFTFVRDFRNVPTKATVKEYDDETNRILLEYSHGAEEWIAPNIVEEAMQSNNDDGTKVWTYEKILGHRKTGNKMECEVLWDTGERSWEPVDVLRKDDPITLAKYAAENGLANQRGWKWARNITKNPKKYLRMLKLYAGQKRKGPKFKFGIQVPRSVKEAYKLDEVNGNTLWGDAIKKEIDQLMEFETFKVEEKGEQLERKGYQFVPIHMTFDVKFDLRRKARLVAGGNWTDPSDQDVYSGVVSIEAVRIALFLAELNGMPICAADVGNAFLHGVTKEKIYTKAGPEFGPDLEGKFLIVYKSLYGLKTSAARWHEALADTLVSLGFKTSKADNDLWMRDCGDHYEYIATYVDDLLIIGKDPMAIIQALKKLYPLKGVGSPEYYLGGDIMRGKDGRLVTSAKTYIKRICEKIEKVMEWKLRHYGSPMDPGYHPECDESDLLVGEDISKYRMMVGCLNWLVTLGRYDVHYTAATMARYGMTPREGHMRAMSRVFGYINSYAKMSVTYDTDIPDFSGLTCASYEWEQFYQGMVEELPYDMPVAKGKPVRVSGYFDANHAGCLQTRRSVTGVVMFLNKTPVKWYSKRQNTVETSTYGSELVAARIATEFAIELRYKLRMLGVPMLGQCVLFGDNKSVVTNVSTPSSMLKKKHNAIAYHRVREAVAARVIDVVHCSTKVNLADILTKALGPSALYNLVDGATVPPKAIEKDQDSGYEGKCQTDHSNVHVTHDDDVTNGVPERSEVLEHVPGVPGQF